MKTENTLQKFDDSWSFNRRYTYVYENSGTRNTEKQPRNIPRCIHVS